MSFSKSCAVFFFFSTNLLLSAKYKYDLAVCAIFQNETSIMREWLEFYKIIGVQHFYLYNNYSTDNYLDILQEYIDKGEVELFDWNFSNKDLDAQNKAYNDALKRSKGVVKWVAFLDLDEFLFPVKEKNLRKFLKAYEEFGAVCANWVMYGTSDIERIPENGLFIEYLVKRDLNGNKHVKSIVRPERAKHFFNCPHFAYFEEGYYQVNPDKVRFGGPFSPYIAIDKLRINHYWARDKYYLYHYKIPRMEALKANLMVLDDDSWYISRKPALSMSAREWVEAIVTKINQLEDRSIQKYLHKMKKMIG